MLFHINNSQLSIKNNPGSLWFYYTLLCDWSRNLTPSCRPIRCKTKNNRDLVIRVFQLANDDVDPFFLIGCSDYFGFGFFDTQLKTSL